MYKKGASFLWILIGVILTLLIVVVIARLSSPEDDWICVNNEWVKHGNPSAPKPEKPCVTLGIFNSDINFSKEGAMASGGGGNKWMLKYSEQGASDLTAGLIFTDRSVCRMGQKINCRDGIWDVGTRVKVDGKKDNKNIEVLNLTVY